ncbi:MAG: hypothetical protein RML35_15050 [Chloroherpetonaceae bacterium]|nr:hypothetical protein [Chloroherpetonaceae bacterium]
MILLTEVTHMSRARLLLLLLLPALILTGCYTQFFADEEVYQASERNEKAMQSEGTTIVIDEYFAPAPYFGSQWFWGDFWYEPWFDPFFASPWRSVGIGWWAPYWRWNGNAYWGWAPYWAWSGWVWNPAWVWGNPTIGNWVWVPSVVTPSVQLRQARVAGRLRFAVPENDETIPPPSVVTPPANDNSVQRRLSSESSAVPAGAMPLEKTQKRTRRIEPDSYALPYQPTPSTASERKGAPYPHLFRQELRTRSGYYETSGSGSGAGLRSSSSSGSTGGSTRSSG